MATKTKRNTVLLITMTEQDSTSGRDRLIVSHGVCLDTGRNIVLPWEHPAQLGGIFDPTLREWVLQE